jgi:hypothetical protein
MSKIARLLAEKLLVSSEHEMVRTLIKRDKDVPYKIKVLWSVFPYSHYAYGIFHGCDLARRLRINKVSILEFGVAGGNGLIAMEQHARQVQELTGVEVEVYGFDTGHGLTAPQDYRDMPYVFATGNYKMDVDRLRERLTNAHLVLGDVKETVDRFFEEYRPAPIAFVSFDMDYYSSTMNGFRLFAESQDESHFLPRVFMHFDDIVGSERSMYNEFVGELAAIKEFNSMNGYVKIAENRVFRNYNLNFSWYHQSYIMHRFQNPLFGRYISRGKPESLSLRDR